MDTWREGIGFGEINNVMFFSFAISVEFYALMT